MRRFLIVLVLMTVAGCADIQRQVGAPENQAGIIFYGNLRNADVLIGTIHIANLGRAKGRFKLHGTNAIQYTLDPGTYQIKITRSGRLLVNRKLFLSDGQMLEVNIP